MCLDRWDRPATGAERRRSSLGRDMWGCVWHSPPHRREVPMARMIPDAPVPETESKAERHLFERLRDDTPDELVAYHSVAWQTPGKVVARSRESPTSSSRIPGTACSHSKSREAVFASTLSRGSGRRSASPVRSRSKTPSSRQTERRTCSPRRLLGRSDRAARRSASVTCGVPGLSCGTEAAPHRPSA